MKKSQDQNIKTYFRCQEQNQKKPRKTREKTNYSYAEIQRILPTEEERLQHVTYLYEHIDIGLMSEGYLAEIDCLLPTHRRVFSFLYTAKFSLKKVYFSRESIAKATGMSIPSVRDALKELKKVGLISYLSGKDKFTTNLYFVKPILFIKQVKKKIAKRIFCIAKYVMGWDIWKLSTRLINIYSKIRKSFINLCFSQFNLVPPQKTNASRDSFFPKRKKVDGSELSSTAKPQV